VGSENKTIDSLALKIGDSPRENSCHDRNESSVSLASNGAVAQRIRSRHQKLIYSSGISYSLVVLQ
jgi:hypothetical protein